MSAVTVTLKQLAILHFVRSFSDLKGFPPTNEEIADYFGFSSINGAVDHLQRLASKGCIQRERGKSRSITVTNAGYTAVVGPIKRRASKAKQPLEVPA